MGNKAAIAAEAEQYLSGMQVKFQSYKRDWEKFPDKITEKSKEILLKGIKPEVSGGRSSNGFSYSVNIDLDKNKPELEKYLSTVKDQLYAKADKFHAAIREFDGKLDYFRKNDLEDEAMGRLIRHFVQWVDYAKVLTFRYKDTKHDIALPDALLAKKQKWIDKLPAATERKSTAKPTPAQESKPAVDPAQEIREKRQAETARIKAALKAQYTEELQVMKDQYDADLKKLNDEKSRIGKELSEKKAYLDTLGFFQFGEKHATRNAIITLEQTKAELQRKAEALNEHFEQQKGGLEQSVERSWEKQRKNIRKQFPTPKGISLYDVVLLGMDPGSKYTIQEMAELPDVPEEITPYWLNNKIITPLISQGKLRRVTENGRTYYMLP